MKVNIEKLNVTFFMSKKYASEKGDTYIYYKTHRTRPHWSRSDRNKVSIMYKIVDCGNIIKELLKSKPEVYISDLVNIINDTLNICVKADGIVFFDDGDIDKYNTGLIYINNDTVGRSLNTVNHRFDQCYFVLCNDMIPLTMTKTEQKEHDEAKDRANALKDKETFIKEFLGPSIEQIAAKYCAYYNSNLCAIHLFSEIRETSTTNQLCINTLIKNSIGKELEAIGIKIPKEYCFFDRYDRFIGHINLLRCDISLE